MESSANLFDGFVVVVVVRVWRCVTRAGDVRLSLVEAQVFFNTRLKLPEVDGVSNSDSGSSTDTSMFQSKCHFISDFV